MPPKIGEILVGAKAITPDVRDRALGQRTKAKGRFGSALLEVSSISETLVLRALSVQRQVPPANAADLVEIRPDILRLVPAKLAAKLFVVPFRRVGRTVSLAMLDPTDLPAIDEITFLTGLPIAPHIALEVRINAALHRLYGIEVSTRFLDLARRIESTVARPAVEPPPRPPAPVQASIPTPTPIAPLPLAPARPLPPPPPSGAPPPPPSILRGGEAGFALPESGDPWGDGPDGGLATDAPIYTEVFEAQRPAGGPDVSGPRPAGLHPPQSARPNAAAPPVAPPVAPPIAPPPAPAPPGRVHEIDDEDLHRLRSRGASAPAPPPERSTPPAPAPAPPAEPEPALGAVPEAVVQQPSEAALSEPSVDVQEVPPPVATGLVDRLAAAEGRDDVADAVLDATAEHLQKAALFIVQSDRVIGWAARPEPAEGFRKFSLPFKTASVFATLRNTDGFYAGPCPDLPGNREILKALSASGLPNVAVVPVTLRGKTVLFLFGEAAGSTPVNVTPLKRLATMTATALEIILLRNRLRNM